MTHPTCEHVTQHFTDLDEGVLAFVEVLRLRLHLLHCPQCRNLKTGLRRVPVLVQAVSAVEAKEFLPLAQNSLRAALARVADYQPRRHPLASPAPRELERLLQTGADLTLRIMESVHQAFTEGTTPLQAPFLPAAVLAQLPASDTWRWQSRGGARVATLMDTGPGGSRLSLLVAPRGFQTPGHVHFGCEQMLVLDGLLEDGLAAYPTGRWVHFGNGSRHAPLVLNDECWCLIREEGTIRYTGPLGWLRNILAA